MKPLSDFHDDAAVGIAGARCQFNRLALRRARGLEMMSPSRNPAASKRFPDCANAVPLASMASKKRLAAIRQIRQKKIVHVLPLPRCKNPYLLLGGIVPPTGEQDAPLTLKVASADRKIVSPFPRCALPVAAALACRERQRELARRRGEKSAQAL
ncbi:MAG: hypothetical protein LBO00_09595 [Zoogloeaceae bacterium]|jgi:hypothetical protein|nr:hypothetical protein [Zoogloeaceae bacterium]